MKKKKMPYSKEKEKKGRKKKRKKLCQISKPSVENGKGTSINP